MGLSTREHGCYLLLLMHYWTEKRLTDDIEELLIITRLEKESRSVLEKILSRYFQHEGSCFRQKRVEKELRRREQQSAAGSICSEAKAAAARRNARKGGRPKKKPNEKPSENPSPQSQSQSQSNSQLEEDTTTSGGSRSIAASGPNSPGADAKRCLDYYFQKHQEIRGFEPTVDGGRDMTIFKRLLRGYAADAIEQVIDFFFAYPKRTKFTTRDLYNSFDTLYGVLKDKAEGRRA